MNEYTHIDRVEPQEGGISNVFLRENRHVAIEITKLADKFRAEIYHIYSGNPKDAPVKKHKSLIKKIENNDANVVLENALGWIDDNEDMIPKPEEFKEPGKE